jgi:hypothetical protein
MSLSKHLGPMMIAALAAACGSGKASVAQSHPDSGSPSGPGNAHDSGSGADAAGGNDGGAPDYADPSRWLCLPGSSNDVCHQNLDATIVNADGTMNVERHVFATKPGIDCFYVYPTVSTDTTPNSDLVPGKEEISVTLNQAARLTSVCDVYAPLYRQVTLGVLFGSGGTPDREMPYSDVLSAWRYYLAHYNQGRPFMLLGHSQGAGVLKRLVQEQIDANADLRTKLVSAMLIGGNIAVPDGKDVGQDFQNVPLCRSPSQKGCVVAYSTFRATAPPPADSLFGKPRTGPGVVACTDPAALMGGPVFQKPYFLVSDGFAKLGAITVTTPFVTYPDFLRGECVSKNGFDYLELTILGDPADPRPDDIGGDLTPQWGLHLVDVTIAMGDIVSLVGSEAAAP